MYTYEQTAPGLYVYRYILKYHVSSHQFAKAKMIAMDEKQTTTKNGIIFDNKSQMFMYESRYKMEWFHA